MDKILAVFKPVGFSSYDLIRVFKKQTSFKGKIGHAGTLDPFAQGVVLLLLGKATKQFDEIKTWPKTYLAGLRLGASSTTGDPAGEIVSQSNPAKPLKNEVENVLKGFVGETVQQVPAFSAAKHQGQPLYKLARKGKFIEKSKKVVIDKIDLIVYKYPLLTIRVKCSGGTYIRQLAQDIGQKLNTSAYLYFLERESVGSFTLKQAKKLVE